MAPTTATELRRAITICSSAISRNDIDDDQRAELLRLRGNGYRLEGRHDAALADLDAARELRPRNPLVARALALALLTARRHDEAEREIERALLVEPHLEGFLLRCMIHTEAGRPAEGVTDCEAVHGVDPSEQSAYLTARAYAGLARNADAIAVLDRAVGSGDGSPRLRKLLAELRGATRQSPAANASRR